MSYDKGKRRKRKKETIRHKTTATVFASLVIAGAALWMLRIFSGEWEAGTFFSIIAYVSVSYQLAYLSAMALSRKYVSQIEKIINEAKAIASSQNLDSRIAVSSHPDELSSLETALNEMLGKLEESFERERRFVSDASHELRTPVAVMRGYLDILRGWGREDPKLMDESLEAMSEETDRMGRLIEGLLKLARMDRDALGINAGPVGSGALIGKMIEDSQNIRKGRNVKTSKIENFKVIADKDLILECLRALFENAVNYTGENGTITFSAEIKNSCGCISVADDGMGISENDLGTIFYRFSRTESSRKINPSGSGLGLSLVKSIVEAQGGKITVESRQGEGSVFTLQLPLEK